MMMESTTIRDFVVRQRELLDMELQAEEEVDPRTGAAGGVRGRKGNDDDGMGGGVGRSHVLGNLEASDVSVGLYGRTVVQLSRWSSSSTPEEGGATTTPSADNDDNGGRGSSGSGGPGQHRRRDGPMLLPAHRFTVGDEVELRPGGGGSSNGRRHAIGGVISAVSESFVAIALFSHRSNNDQQQLKQQKQSSRERQGKNGSKSDADDTVTREEEETASILNQAPLSLVPRSSVEVHRKISSALSTLERQGFDHPIAGPVIQAMFHPCSSPVAASPPQSSPAAAPPKTGPPFNPRLDRSQLDAIAFALERDRPVALIHGPPGTGKTTTVAELIRQAVFHHGMRVLVTAPSNVAVDNVLERLVAMEDDVTTKLTGRGKRGGVSSVPSQQEVRRRRLRTVRLGHPARIKSSIVAHSLEALVQASEGTEIIQDVRRELQSFLKVLSNPRSRGQDKRIAYREIKSLRREVRVREEKVVQELIASADVVLATTVGAASRILDKSGPENSPATAAASSGFDLVIIDEAAQALEASCWIPILRGRKVVLAGDHCQLPPTIKSKNRQVVAGLSVTMFERLMTLYDDGSRDNVSEDNDDAGRKKASHRQHPISRMLQIQYRMHHDIADWASQAMYNGELLTHDSVRNRTLRQLLSVERATAAEGVTASSRASRSDVEAEDDMRDTVLLLVDTAGCDMHEQTTLAGSKFNEGEAEIVCQHVRGLLKMGVEPDQVAVITPYNGQVELLRGRLLPDFPRLEIRSVDGFQGGEREAVVLSLVRSSPQGGKTDGIGFLRDDRRQNVAVTRAKRHLAVVCDTETVSQSPFIRSLIAWIEGHGEQHSGVEYMAQTTTSKEYCEDDLQATEADLMKLVQVSLPASVQQQKPEKNVEGKDASQADKALEESKRRALMDKIAAFSETGVQGDEMPLNSELSSYDRRLVHEFAEQLNLGHRSEGIEHVDRRIILTILVQGDRKKDIQEVGSEATSAPSVEMRDAVVDREKPVASTSQIASFAALALDAGDSADSDSQDEVSEMSRYGGEQFAKAAESNVPAANSLLAQLAADRFARKQKTASVVSTSQSSSGKEKSKKRNSQKIGISAPKPAPSHKEDQLLDDMDDMTFLEVQIEKSQNAHGRNVVGSGKDYRTIVNGILNSRPEPYPKPRDDRASAALQCKLKEAQKARKSKKTKDKSK